MIIEIIAVLVAVTAVIWVIAAVFLSAPDHSSFDEPPHDLHFDRSSVSAENADVLRLVKEMQNQLRGVSKAKRLFKLRCIFDEGFTGSPSEAEQLGVNITPVDAGGVSAEWIVAPGASTDRRLLYIHGGAFTIGSPRSHRMITSALSKALPLVLVGP